MTQKEREDELILALCREAGPDRNADGTTTADWSHERVIDGFRSNHFPDLIADAANGDVKALIKLRMACSLPIFS